MAINLPPSIAAYFDADRTNDARIVECFTPDAIVLDEGHTYNGTSDIRRWRAEAASKYTYDCEPRKLEIQGDETIVTCHLVGNFPGSPVDLRFFFNLADDKIASLKVIP